MLIKIIVGCLVVIFSAAAAATSSDAFPVTHHHNIDNNSPVWRTIRDIRVEQVKRSIAHLNQFAGFDTLAGMGLGKRAEPEQAGEKRAALGTFDSLGGMGLGKRSSPFSSNIYDYQKRNQLSQLDTLAGMGFGRK